jgi:hypothetical protein
MLDPPLCCHFAARYSINQTPPGDYSLRTILTIRYEENAQLLKSSFTS